ncbi:MAG: dTDP-4-dehydrorhamnose 3,5-epimerase [Acidobacteria bacterium]|nr:dTDP-4-dehydrorhamnose 3,5-epimerase [Acidobacteriota bacterium]
MEISQFEIEGLVLVRPQVFRDPRGYFIETYQAERFRKVGILDTFVQDNQSCSTQGTLRGLHFQVGQAQAKLVRVVLGEVFDVAVDLRRGSPTYGRWQGVHLSDQNHYQFYVPKGFAHGFQVVSERAVFAYKCSDYYAPECERGLIWNDTDLSIKWPLRPTQISEKDANWPTLAQLNLD